MGHMCQYLISDIVVFNLHMNMGRCEIKKYLKLLYLGQSHGYHHVVCNEESTTIASKLLVALENNRICIEKNDHLA